MADVFISYASGDRPRVKKLVEILEADGYLVWWDRQIDVGTSFDKEIEAAIDQAKCIVVVWSEASIVSDWVRAEAADGLERGILVPVLFDDVRPPLLFRQLQACRLIERTEFEGDELEKLVRKISTQLSSQGKPSKSESQLVHSATVLVADVVNETEMDIYSGSIDEALRLSFEDMGLYVYPREQAVQILDRETIDIESATRLGAREGLDFVIGGRIRESAEGHRIELEIRPTTDLDSVIRHSSRIEGENAVAETLADLTSSARDTLLQPGQPNHFHSEELSFVNLEAFKAYNTAQRLASEEHYEESIPYYRTAVKHDPGMGRALGGWAVAAYNLGQVTLARDKWRQALKNLERMTEPERLRTLGVYYALGSQNFEKAGDTFRQLLQHSPLDARALNNLAVVTFSQLDFQGALEAGRRAAEVFPDSLLYLNNYALYAMYASDFKTARQQAEDVLSRSSKFTMAYIPVAISALMDGEIRLAQELYESMQAVDKRGASVACMALVDIDMTNGRSEEAIQKLRAGIDQDRSNDNARGEAAKILMLAECLSGKQDTRSLVEELDRARALNLEPARLVTLGALYAKAGDLDKARSVADELGSKLGRHERAYGRIVGAECLAAESRFGDAVDMLRSAFDLADVWYGHFLRAQLFVRAGHVFEGLEEYEACMRRCGEASAIYLDDVPTFRFVQQARELHQRAIELL